MPMNFKDVKLALLKYNKGRPPVADIDVAAAESEEFQKLQEKRRKKHQQQLKNTTGGISTFHSPKDGSFVRPLLFRLQEEGRNRFLEKRTQLLWDNNMLSTLQEIISKNSDKDGTLSYGTFDIVRKEFYKAFPQLPQNDLYGLPSLNAPLFLKLSAGNPSCRVDGAHLLQAITREVFIYQTRNDLYAVESDNNGSLRETDLETFLTDAIPMCHALAALPPSHYPFYVCTAMRRFAHFLKPLRYGKVATSAVMTSVPMEEFIEVVMAKDADSVMHNWFGYYYPTLAYEKYSRLDKDNDGMLSYEELRIYKKGSPPLEDPGIDGTFTDIFYHRFFDVTNTYGGLVDYKKYVDFVFLVETLPTYPNLELFWKIFDIHEEGSLSPMVCNLFIREVNKKLEILNLVSCSLENLVTEIMDVLSCGHGMKITKQEFMKNPNSGLFCSLMIDYHALVMYEQREAQIAQQVAQQQQQQQR
eukprot:PhF_6_TR4362/c0_g1_i1/m.5892/K11583/PPP2R3; serine/threonine-protein phosphatase 2A regulatory subunit B''